MIQIFGRKSYIRVAIIFIIVYPICVADGITKLGYVNGCLSSVLIGGLVYLRFTISYLIIKVDDESLNYYYPILPFFKKHILPLNQINEVRFIIGRYNYIKIAYSLNGAEKKVQLETSMRKMELEKLCSLLSSKNIICYKHWL